MDEHGIETAVLFPTRVGSICRMREQEFAEAVARAFNILVAREYASVSPRLRPVGVLALHDPLRAAEELRYAVTELGLVSFEILRAAAAPGLGDRRYDPVWAEAQRLDVALCIHGSRSPSTAISVSGCGRKPPAATWTTTPSRRRSNCRLRLRPPLSTVRAGRWSMPPPP